MVVSVLCLQTKWKKKVCEKIREATRATQCTIQIHFERLNNTHNDSIPRSNVLIFSHNKKKNS